NQFKSMENEKSLKLLWGLKIGMRLLKRLKGVYWGITRPRFVREATENGLYKHKLVIAVELSATLCCAAPVWIQNNNISVWMLMAGGATSELGLWMFDLSVTQTSAVVLHCKYYDGIKFLIQIVTSLEEYRTHCSTIQFIAILYEYTKPKDNAIAKRGRGRPPTPTTADKGMTLGNNGVKLDMENAIELEQDNAIAERGRGRPPKNNSGRTGRPPTNADKIYSEYYKILEKSDYLTGETVRDKWLGKLLQGIEYVCDSKDYGKDEHKEKYGSLSHEKETALWPDVDVTAIVALEKASHDAFSGDSEKYIKIVRQNFTRHQMKKGKQELDSSTSQTKRNTSTEGWESVSVKNSDLAGKSRDGNNKYKDSSSKGSKSSDEISTKAKLNAYDISICAAKKDEYYA
ncbi:hypothetical protein C5167_050088, partial [Papaver somniferum]